MSKSEIEHPAYRYGTDKQYLDWLSYQPSCVDGSFNQWKDGRGRNIACHVRRILSGAGMGKKPPFSAVPMTDKQHKLQSVSERTVLIKYGILEDGDHHKAREWFDHQAQEHLNRWIKTRKK